MDPKHHIDPIGAFVSVAVVLVYAFTVAMPYFLTDATPELIQLIDRNKGTVDTVTVAVVMFYVGTSYGSRTKDAAIEKQASTIQAAQAALTPSEPAIPVASGESVTVKGVDA